MKSISTLAAVILLHFSSNAQPVITQSGVANNFNADFYYADATGFSPGSAGANQTWDYSDLETMYIGTDTAIPVSGSPYAATFPTANYLYKFNGPFTGGDLYFYNNVTSEKFEILSLGYDSETGDNYAPNGKTYVTFPYTFGTIFTDSFQSTTETSSTTFTATYDAYGTLIMPFGTFTNVVRQKVVSNGQTDYNWFNVSPFYPILQTVLAENTLGIIQDHTNLAVDDFADSAKFTVYPNPVHDQLNIRRSGSGNMEIVVSDVSGKIVLKQFVGNGEQISVDLTTLTAGIYFLSAKDSKGTETRKIVKQ
ncbi:MAG: T9SS type A sorting domain-containing protein [Flavobacterium sp.]|nr:MAG: T9SS type A sorting domain-containing protein [Flavobacterium sp.]